MNIEAIRGYSTMLGFLQLTLRREPEINALQAQHFSDLFCSAPCAGGDGAVREGLRKLSKWADGDIGAEAIGLDYRVLFEGPEMPLCPPWESAFLSADGLLMQKETIEVRSFYGRYGLMMNSPFNEPDDHIALELAFCAVLLDRAAEALESREEAVFQTAMEALRDFTREHLFRWGVEWARGLSENAATLYYQGIGCLLEGTLQGLSADLCEADALR